MDTQPGSAAVDIVAVVGGACHTGRGRSGNSHCHSHKVGMDCSLQALAHCNMDMVGPGRVCWVAGPHWVAE